MVFEGATLIADVFSRFVELLDVVDDDDGDDGRSLRLHRHKDSVFCLVRDLSADSIPMVRRRSLLSLGAMVSVLGGSGSGGLSLCRYRSEVISLYLPLFKKLASDDQDNVRVFAVETLLRFGPLLSAEEVVDHLLYHIRLLALDSAWRVRYIAADHFIALCTMLDTETIRDSMINYFIRLLEDQEPEVRAVAISKIPGISKLIGVALSIEKLIPIVKQLVADCNKYARASLAAIIIPFCYLLPHRVVTEHILQCILLILKDQFPNVRLHVISNICCHGEGDDGDGGVGVGVNVDGAESTENGDKFDISLLEESVIPSVMELSLDNDWRVRLGITDKLPALAKQFGRRFFDDRLFDLSMAALEDNVADIRLSAASNQLQIAKVFNFDDDAADRDSEPFEWATSLLIPALIRKVRDSKHYLHRIVYLLSFKFLIEGLGPNEAMLNEIVRSLSTDTVANVRFKACQILTFLAEHQLIARPALSQQIGPKIQNVIREDPDVDVVFFATQCLDAVERALKQ